MIEVTGLSSITGTESLRVSGLGDARLLVVNCLREQFTEISESDPVRVLKSRKRELQAERDARKVEIEILKAFGEEMGDKPDLTPDQANAFADTLFEKTLTCAKTVKALGDEIEEIKRKINKAKSEKAGSAFVKAVITVVANDDGPAQLKLTYRQSQFTTYLSFIPSPVSRCGCRLLVSSLRPVRHFGRRKAVDLCVPSLSRQLTTEDWRGLERRKTDPQHVCD